MKNEGIIRRIGHISVLYSHEKKIQNKWIYQLKTGKN